MLTQRLFDLRNRLLSSPRFRKLVQKLPIFQSIANRQAYDLFRTASGFIHSQVLCACVRTGLFDVLQNGALGVDEVADKTGLPPARALHLLRAAAALKLTEERSGGRFGIGMLGASMLDNAPLNAIVEHNAVFYEDLVDPVALFANEATETRMAALWPYAGTDQPAALAVADVERYTSLMAASQAIIAEQVIAAYPMRRHDRLLDIGGGAGAFAAAVARRWSHLDITLTDLPAVAEIARNKLTEQGLGERIRVVGADAIADDLPGGFDLVSFVRILHDHDDDRVFELLRVAHGCLDEGGVLLVAEPIAGKRGAGPLIDVYFQVYLLAMGSGRPRTFKSLKSLLLHAGFRHVRRRRTAVPLLTSVIVARR